VGGAQAAVELAPVRARHIETDTARPDHPAPEAAAAYLRGQVKEFTSEPSAIGGGGKISDISGKRTQIADVIGDTFEFQGDAAKHERACRHRRAAERLESLAIGGAVSDRGIAGGGLDEMERAFARTAHEHPFDSTMLVAESDFEMKHLLAVALKAEVAGLDDAGMNGPDRDLVDFLALHRKETLLARLSSVVAADRLEPWMSLRDDVPLLRDFTFEPMGLRTFDGKRGIGAINYRAKDRDVSVDGIGNHGDKTDVAPARRRSKQGG